MLQSSNPVQDRSRSLRNLSTLKSLDKDDRAILTWLTGVVGYKINDYSMYVTMSTGRCSYNVLLVMSVTSY